MIIYLLLFGVTMIYWWTIVMALCSNCHVMWNKTMMSLAISYWILEREKITCASIIRFSCIYYWNLAALTWPGGLRGLTGACWTTDHTTNRVRISAWAYLKGVSSLTWRRGRSAHLAYHMHKSGRKTSIIILTATCWSKLKVKKYKQRTLNAKMFISSITVVYDCTMIASLLLGILYTVESGLMRIVHLWCCNRCTLLWPTVG